MGNNQLLILIIVIIVVILIVLAFTPQCKTAVSNMMNKTKTRGRKKLHAPNSRSSRGRNPVQRKNVPDKFKDIRKFVPAEKNVQRKNVPAKKTFHGEEFQNGGANKQRQIAQRKRHNEQIQAERMRKIQQQTLQQQTQQTLQQPQAQAQNVQQRISINNVEAVADIFSHKKDVQRDLGISEAELDKLAREYKAQYLEKDTSLIRNKHLNRKKIQAADEKLRNSFVRSAIGKRDTIKTEDFMGEVYGNALLEKHRKKKKPKGRKGRVVKPQIKKGRTSGPQAPRIFDNMVQ